MRKRKPHKWTIISVSLLSTDEMLWLNFQSFFKIGLIKGYFIANFSYCPLVRVFSSAISNKKIGKLQTHALRFSYNSYGTATVIDVI